MRSLFVILAVAAGLPTAKAGPFAPPPPVADAVLPAGLAGTAVAARIDGDTRDDLVGITDIAGSLSGNASLTL